MEVLYILRSKPDETVESLMKTVSNGDGTKLTRLFEGHVDWSKLVDDIFSHDKVICWW